MPAPSTNLCFSFVSFSLFVEPFRMLRLQNINSTLGFWSVCKGHTFGFSQTAGLWWRPQILRTTTIPEKGGKQEKLQKKEQVLGSCYPALQQSFSSYWEDSVPWGAVYALVDATQRHIWERELWTGILVFKQWFTSTYVSVWRSGCSMSKS